MNFSQLPKPWRIILLQKIRNFLHVNWHHRNFKFTLKQCHGLCSRNKCFSVVWRWFHFGKWVRLMSVIITQNNFLPNVAYHPVLKLDCRIRIHDMKDATPRDVSDSKRSHRSHVRITGKKTQSVPENNTMPRASHPHLPRCIFRATNHTLKCTFMDPLQ